MQDVRRQRRRLRSRRGPVSYTHLDVYKRQHYARLAKAGVDFGPAFRTVEAVRTAKGEAWARVSLQEPEKHEASQYLFHPALLDGCLQAAVAAMADSLDGPYLPLSLDR